MNTQVRTFLDLSTGHLTPRTRRDLETRAVVDLPFAGGPTRYGWFAYAHDENSGVGGDQIHSDLWACMCFARTLGCDYLMFDCDAEVIAELPYFEDETDQVAQVAGGVS